MRHIIYTFFQLKIIRSNQSQQTALYLIIRKIQQKTISATIVILDSKIATLINHWKRIFRIGLVVHKLIQGIILSSKLVYTLMIMVHQTNKIRWCARSKPKVTDAPCIKGIQHTERIIDIYHTFTKMVTIISLLQLLTDFLFTTPLGYRHFPNRFGKNSMQFFFRDATKRFIIRQHTDIQWLIETTEHAYLREFRHTCQKYKTQKLISLLKDGIECFQGLPVARQQFFIMLQHIQQRFVVFVNQYHRSTAAALAGNFQNLVKTRSQIKIHPWNYSVFLFPIRQIAGNLGLQCSGQRIVSSIKVYMKYNMSLPILFQLRYFQSGKQFFPTLEISFQGGKQQALAKTARAAEEVHLSTIRQGVDQIRFINIDKPPEIIFSKVCIPIGYFITIIF